MVSIYFFNNTLCVEVISVQVASEECIVYRAHCSPTAIINKGTVRRHTHTHTHTHTWLNVLLLLMASALLPIGIPPVSVIVHRVVFSAQYHLNTDIYGAGPNRRVVKGLMPATARSPSPLPGLESRSKDVRDFLMT